MPGSSAAEHTSSRWHLELRLDHDAISRRLDFLIGFTGPSPWGNDYATGLAHWLFKSAAPASGETRLNASTQRLAADHRHRRGRSGVASARLGALSAHRGGLTTCAATSGSGRRTAGTTATTANLARGRARSTGDCSGRIIRGGYWHDDRGSSAPPAVSGGMPQWRRV